MTKTSVLPTVAPQHRRTRRVHARRHAEDERTPTVESPAAYLQHTAGNQALSRLAHHDAASPVLVRSALQRLVAGPRIQRIVDAEIDQLVSVRGEPFLAPINGALDQLQAYNQHMHSGASPAPAQQQQLAGAGQILSGIVPRAGMARFGDKLKQRSGLASRQVEVAAEVRQRLQLETAALQKYRDARSGQEKDQESGAVNTVYSLLFGDGWEAIWKRDSGALPVDEYGKGEGTAGVIAEDLGISLQNPNFGGRNVAFYRLDKLLGTGVIPRTKRAPKNEQAGILMQKVKGKQLQGKQQVGTDEVDTIPDLDMANAEIQRGLSNLQILDAIAGQIDRHPGNVFVEVDAQGRVVGMKGIDNDFAFGVRNMDVTGRVNYSYYQGMPNFVDLRTATRIAGVTEAQVRETLAGLLTAAEIDKTVERFLYARAYCQSLLEYARTGDASARFLVTTWNAATYQAQIDQSRQNLREHGYDADDPGDRYRFKAGSYLYSRSQELAEKRADPTRYKLVPLVEWKRSVGMNSLRGRVVKPLLRQPPAAQQPQ